MRSKSTDKRSDTLSAKKLIGVTLNEEINN